MKCGNKCEVVMACSKFETVIKLSGGVVGSLADFIYMSFDK